MALVPTSQVPGSAETVQVRHPETLTHGFLSLTTQEGKVIAVGDLVETVRGWRVTSRLVFHFKDGSLDEETTVFTQHGSFRLISDHHIQRGPYFKHPFDMTVDVPKETVVVRSPGKDGKEEVVTEHTKMPPDLYNGLITPIVKNLSPDNPQTTVHMIVATPKPRLISLVVLPRSPDTFLLAGFPRRALAYEIKIELGGLAGIIAPVIGKQPPNHFMWIVGGEVPTFLRETGPLVEDGEVVSINLIGPTWPNGK